MDDGKRTPNLMLARYIAEVFLDDKKVKLNQDSFYMFSVSKFILLKERIVKKDSNNNTLYFDNELYYRYIPVIMDFFKTIKITGSYKINNCSVVLKNKKDIPFDFESAIWCFNKVRDSLAHGNYKFDYFKRSIVIDNVASDNSYALKCNLPLDLINSFSFIVETNIEKPTKEEFFKKYYNYIKEMAEPFDVPFDQYNIINPFIINYYKKYNNIIIDKEKINKNLSNIKNEYYNTYNYNHYKYDNPYIIKTGEENKDVNVINKVDKKDYTYDKSVIDKKVNNTIDDDLREFNIEEINKLYKEISSIKPKTNEEKEYIINLYKRIKKLLSSYEDKKITSDFDDKTRDILSEMKNILGIKNKCDNPNAIISIYNYLSLLFSQVEIDDYSKLLLDDLYYKSSNKSFDNINESIKRKSNDFITRMNTKITNYTNNPNLNFKNSIAEKYSLFICDILNSIGIKNKYVITSIRNSIEHGNYKYIDSGYIVLYDQSNHNDNSTINFVSAINPQGLFNIGKQIDCKNNEFTLNNLMSVLKSILDSDIYMNLINTLNELSNIIYGKELDMNCSIDSIINGISNKNKKNS